MYSGCVGDNVNSTMAGTILFVHSLSMKPDNNTKIDVE